MERISKDLANFFEVPGMYNSSLNSDYQTICWDHVDVV